MPGTSRRSLRRRSEPAVRVVVLLVVLVVVLLFLVVFLGGMTPPAWRDHLLTQSNHRH